MGLDWQSAVALGLTAVAAWFLAQRAAAAVRRRPRANCTACGGCPGPITRAANAGRPRVVTESLSASTVPAQDRPECRD
ncbi:MAG: hypothetical protein A2W31_07355 [Planctomycetes bacterium RBG_16_64_10]|nr:MAG: hypothetical protein A2W31_07355 [Planctomycetes bacterium RBG_16_64_10]